MLATGFGISRRYLGAIAIAAALCTVPPARAATITVGSGQAFLLTETNSGNNSSGNAPTHNTSDISGLTGSGSFTYANGFTSQQTVPFVTNGSGSWGFYDDYVFTVGSGQVDSITSSITLGSSSGITGLQARLYDYTANGGVVPLLTAPVVGSAFDAWSTSVPIAPGVTGTYAVLSATTLAAGTYVLELRGTATGTGGGSYAGVLDVTPVPLPGGLPLLVGACGMLGGFLRRRGALKT